MDARGSKEKDDLKLNVEVK
ncbi:unnamed protein product, partial [Allacma fusca]